MPIRYENVVPWGRNLEEYKAMFALEEKDLEKRILGCGDGPASFNYQMTRAGRQVVSIDPTYCFTPEQLEERFNQVYENVIEQTRANREKFVWTTIGSPEELGEMRMASMKKFLADFEQGKNQKRYIYGELPDLPFGDKEFDLALCSHFLFLYSDNLTLQFHQEAISAMCRVAREVRIFPLIDVNINRSPYVDPVKTYFESRGYTVEEIKVNYEFQKGGNAMLRITV